MLYWCNPLQVTTPALRGTEKCQSVSSSVPRLQIRMFFLIAWVSLAVDSQECQTSKSHTLSVCLDLVLLAACLVGREHFRLWSWNPSEGRQCSRRRGFPQAIRTSNDPRLPQHYGGTWTSFFSPSKQAKTGVWTFVCFANKRCFLDPGTNLSRLVLQSKGEVFYWEDNGCFSRLVFHVKLESSFRLPSSKTINP